MFLEETSLFPPVFWKLCCTILSTGDLWLQQFRESTPSWERKHFIILAGAPVGRAPTIPSTLPNTLKGEQIQDEGQIVLQPLRILLFVASELPSLPPPHPTPHTPTLHHLLWRGPKTFHSTCAHSSQVSIKPDDFSESNSLEQLETPPPPFYFHFSLFLFFSFF